MIILILALRGVGGEFERCLPRKITAHASLKAPTIPEYAMAFQKVVDCVEIDMIYTYNSVPAQNVFYARLVGGYSQAQIQTLADAVDGAWAATFPGDQPVEVSYVRTEVRGLAVPNDITAQSVVSAGPGTHTGNALPSQVTFSIKKTSGLTGRSARGRTYWIGIPDNELEGADENFVKAAYAAQMVADIDFIRSTIEGTGAWEAVLVSRWFENVKRSEGEVFPWTGTTNVDLRVDTNRSRLPSG